MSNHKLLLGTVPNCRTNGAVPKRDETPRRSAVSFNFQVQVVYPNIHQKTITNFSRCLRVDCLVVVICYFSFTKTLLCIWLLVALSNHLLLLEQQMFKTLSVVLCVNTTACRQQSGELHFPPDFSFLSHVHTIIIFS
jgi:hypothetical protein